MSESGKSAGVKRPSSLRSGRLPVGFAVAVVVALSCVGSVAMANVRPAADVCLLQLSAYGVTDFAASFGWAPKVQVARLELGAKVTDNIGITAGAAVGELWAIFGISAMPLSARVYWDFTPDELWVRRTAYVTASYQRIFDLFNMTNSSHVILGFGGTYTYYAITTRAELFAPVAKSPVLGLLVGVEVGGSYIFGRHHDPDAADWGN